MPAPPWPQRGLHVIVKPIGPICNLACRYCFYLRKEALYGQGETWRMSDETLCAYVRQYFAAQPPGVKEVDFAFQGGEPTLLGLDFFRRLVEIQQELCPPGKRACNSIQTNGLLLDDAWCEFLARNRFLVGLSIDGPAELHDAFRVDRSGAGTLERVTPALERLKRHAVEFNALVCVHRRNAEHPLEVYRFLKGQGVKFLQFIPIVERAAGDCPDFRDRAPSRSDGRRENGTVPLPGPDGLGGTAGLSSSVRRTGGQATCATRQIDCVEPLATPWSVLPDAFGRFLIAVFDEWIGRDVGRMFVRDFDQALSAWVGTGPSLCTYAPQCGRALALEHNGDLYSCDHFVDLPHKLGNIHDRAIADLANSVQQERFGLAKSAALPEVCRSCHVRFVCNGACPKDRFLVSPDGQPGLNYLCAGYKAFFTHVAPHMKAMAAELQAGRPAANVMHRLRARARPASGVRKEPGRNDPCRCGSGRKFKHCCGRPGP